MEILRFLLSFFLKEYGGGKIEPVLNLLSENSFDIKKTLENLSPEKVAPILKSVFSADGQKNSPAGSAGDNAGLKPIESFCDKEVAERLNAYFA